MTAFEQAKHLFWKEYRTQRGMWIGLVGFGLLFHMVMKLSFKFRQDGDLEFMFASGYLTTLFYALASAAMLYSAEREQGTDVLIRTMPLNKWLFLGTKFAWVVLSSLAGLVLFGISAIVWTRSFSRVIEYQEPTGYLIYAFVFLLAVLSPLIASLLTRQVLSAIGVAIVLSFMAYWLVYVGGMYLLDQFVSHKHFLLYSFRHYYHFSLPVVLSIVALDLNRRWFYDSDFSWRWNWRLSRPKTLTVAIAEASYSNSWRRLVWKEWRSARVWLPFLFAVSAYIALVTLKGPYDTEKRVLHFAVNMCLIPLLAGYASCRGDQAHDRYRFLGNRGISSLQILFTKHAVWLGGCILLLLFVTVYAWNFPRYIENQRLRDFAGSLSLIPISTGLISSVRAEELSASLIPAIEFWGSLCLLFYSLGHWFSISLKQSVMSLMVSVVLTLPVGLVVCFYYALDVPLFIIAIAPSAALLGISFVWGENWVTDRRERRDLMLPFWYGMLGCWTVITLLASWRVMEIPFAVSLNHVSKNILLFQYLPTCLIVVIGVAVACYLSDWIRTNLRTTSGKALLMFRQDFRLTRILLAALIVHNLLSLAVVLGYHFVLKAELQSSFALIESDIHRFVDRKDNPDLYTVANDAIDDPMPLSPNTEPQGETADYRRRYASWDIWEEVTAEQHQWWQKHREALPLFWTADADGELITMQVEPALAGGVKVPNAAGWTDSVRFVPKSFQNTNVKLINLIRLEALYLEHEGKLAEAWKHHVAVVRYARRFAEYNLPSQRHQVFSWLNTVILNSDLWRWQARAEQSPELLAQASLELIDELSQLSFLSDSFQREAAWTELVFGSLSSLQFVMEENLAAGMPWEMQRFRAMLHAHYQLATSVSDQIDRNQVSLTQGDHLADPTHFYYEFPDPLNGKTFSLKVDSINYESPSLSRLNDAQDVLVSVELPVSVVETTLIARHTPRQIATVFFDFSLGDMLRQELDFWRNYRSILASFAIYSFRAEVGQFPAALYDLKRTKTEKLFDPILPHAAVNIVEPEPDLLSWSAGILQHDANVRSYKADFDWYHASKWPQPEYNLGETPDRKPLTPLIAPEPPVAHPFEEDFGMGAGFHSLEDTTGLLNAPEPSEAQP